MAETKKKLNYRSQSFSFHLSIDWLNNSPSNWKRQTDWIPSSGEGKCRQSKYLLHLVCENLNHGIFSFLVTFPLEAKWREENSSSGLQTKSGGNTLLVFLFANIFGSRCKISHWNTEIFDVQSSPFRVACLSSGKLRYCHFISKGHWSVAAAQIHRENEPFLRQNTSMSRQPS